MFLLRFDRDVEGVQLCSCKTKTKPQKVFICYDKYWDNIIFWHQPFETNELADIIRFGSCHQLLVHYLKNKYKAETEISHTIFKTTKKQ